MTGLLAGKRLLVIAGYDARNPIALEQDPAVFAEIAPAALRGLRVAWAPDLGGRVAVEPEVIDTLTRRVRVLESLGCVVEEACPDLDGAAEALAGKRVRHGEAAPVMIFFSTPLLSS